MNCILLFLKQKRDNTNEEHKHNYFFVTRFFLYMKEIL